MSWKEPANRGSCSNTQSPFAESLEVLQIDLGQVRLPGSPRTTSQDSHGIAKLLEDELIASDLEALAPKLWVMSTQSGANVNPLHRQRVKGREIIITQEPRLHLVWIYDRIFVKPLPQYLMSYTFWRTYLLDENSPLGSKRQEILRAAFGYMRSYHYLIVYESDFEIAREIRLLPQWMKWDQFCNFATWLAEIEDSEVSGRYHYGEIRLTRLNFYVKFFLRKWQYERIEGQYGAYFSRFYGPALFIFALWTVQLSAMQVELDVETVAFKPWDGFQKICRWFSILTIVGITLLAIALAMLLVGMIVDEWIFALRCLLRRKRSERSLHQGQNA